MERDVEVDGEYIRQVMTALGEGLWHLGFPKPIEIIEGKGVVGKAVADAGSYRSLKTINDYLKAVDRDLQQEPQDNPAVLKARRGLNMAFRKIQAAVHLPA